jgi:hypothetical protein
MLASGYTGIDADFDLLIEGPLRIILGYIACCAILSFFLNICFVSFICR